MITQYALRNKILTPLLLMILCTCCALTASVHAQPVHIPDPNLKQAVSEALNLPVGSPITEADMRQLTTLNAVAREIIELTGLEYATNLTELRLGGNPIRDISPLAYLTQLTRLRLNECWTIDDISPLADLTQLNRLDLDRNLIVDIRPLAGLTALTSLDLRGNRIIDVSPLANLMQLAELRLSDNQIVDITPLANLTNLIALWLSDNQITDVTALANLTQLTVLLLSNNRIEDISPLENLTNLEQLDTHNNPIFDPESPLVEVRDPNLRAVVREALNLPDGVPLNQASMRKLTRLDARNRQITTLTGLEHALNLTELNLAGNNISDLVPIVRPIANLMQLTALYLGGNRIEDISPLANLTQLAVLRLNENWRIEDISSLANLVELRKVDLDRNEIVDISPLARLTKLESLDLRDNRIIDVRPLANLTQLTQLRLSENRIVDITPLVNLTNLVALWLSGNRITDVTALVNLTQLTDLRLNENRIVDVSPLVRLTKLELLDFRLNPITDYSLLDALAISHFFYNQTCEMPPLPLEPRLENRNYPSIFARWSGFGWPPVRNRPDLSDAENLALHDLRFSVNVFGLNYLKGHDEFTISGDVDEAIRQRDELLSLNPNMIHLVDIDLREAPLSRFPEDWPGWIRDEHGDIFIEWHQGQPEDDHGLLDFRQPAVQDIIVQQAIAVSKCGLYDGVMSDYWHENWIALSGWDGTRQHVFSTLEEEVRAREIIVQRIQAETRPNFLIMGNTNDRIIPRTGPYVNGGFMETGIPEHMTGAELELAVNAAENSLLWLENNLREPRINALEGFSIPGEPLDSPNNQRWMRALTTLSLTHSDGYVMYTESLFSDNPTGSFWYNFWDADLGRPVGEKAQLYQETEGLYIREYTNGWAVYNHSGSEQQITLPELAVGVASRLEGNTHTLSDIDGEMYLRVKPANPADVNGDGVVNILDLVVVAQAFGKDGLQGDVNGDGVVNVFDLVFVAGAIGGGGAAPSAYSLELSIISAADVERWLALAQGLGAGDANFQRGIRFLEGLLTVLTPKETTLLPNYPNPFNPETWIPYHLAREAEVAITIYDTKGTPVRRLALGNQAAGYYAERGKAAYWDGRNEDGETVASGIYIYQFLAGDYAASRRMVIVK